MSAWLMNWRAVLLLACQPECEVGVDSDLNCSPAAALRLIACLRAPNRPRWRQSSPIGRAFCTRPMTWWRRCREGGRQHAQQRQHAALASCRCSSSALLSACNGVPAALCAGLSPLPQGRSQHSTAAELRWLAARQDQQVSNLEQPDRSHQAACSAGFRCKQARPCRGHARAVQLGCHQPCS